MFNTLTRMGASAAGAYEIERSLRFNDEDSAYLHRTFSSDGNLKLFTYSFWFKSDVAVNADGDLNSPPIFGAGYSGGGGTQGDSGIRIDSGQLNVYHESNNSTDWSLKTKRVFRDPASWYHVVVAFDTAQSTEADRLKLWINGVLQTDFATSGRPSQNDDCKQNKANVRIGARDGSGSPYDYFEGYLADWHVVDGAAKEAADFGETDPTTDQWIPKKYSGSHGTNGYHLNFADNSGATSSTIGADASANSNDFTPVNFSVSAGIDNDSLEDTPTNNYCTLNPLVKTYGSYTYKQGNLQGDADGNWNLSQSTFAAKSGKWYCEVVFTAGTNSNWYLGAAIQNVDAHTINPQERTGIYYYGYGNKKVNGALTSYGASYTTDDVIGIALNIDDGEVTFYKNGTSQGAISFTYHFYGPPVCFAFSVINDVINVNFGQRAFAHTPPTGFKTFCTQNLPTPTIKKGSDHFVTKTYSGTGSTQTITTALDADLVWVKRRDSANYHILANTVSGHSNYLVSNNSDAESIGGGSQLINGLSSTGFQVGTENAVNNSSGTYVSWNWKESASAGFDIVTYTGTGSNADISHSLGVAPEIVFYKNRDSAEDWAVYYNVDNVGAGVRYLKLNTDAVSTYNAASYWQGATSTSSVLKVGTDDDVNHSSEDHFAFAFTSVDGYSRVGTYIGNGNANGPFVYCGFRPAYILIKRLETTPNAYWNIFDTVRDPYNSTTTADFKRILAHVDSAEATNHTNYTPPDILSNGFKLRHGRADTNYSAKSFLYLAFAESPFKYANAR